MNRVVLVVMIVLVVIALAGCAAGPNNFEDTKNEEGKTAGFLRGLWHGFISFFTFIISLFTDRVSVYEVHNNGGWYNFGFILGIMIFYGGGSKGTCTRRERI